MTSAPHAEDLEAGGVLWTGGLMSTGPTWLEGVRRWVRAESQQPLLTLTRPMSPEFTSGKPRPLHLWPELLRWGRGVSFITRFSQNMVVGPEVIGTRCWALNRGT